MNQKGYKFLLQSYKVKLALTTTLNLRSPAVNS